MAKAEAKAPGEGTCGSCPVDSHFNVKGVGTVILGSVIDGYFRKHDKMTVFPIKREVILKSIQKHDLDADDGVKGDHVGLALRGIESLKTKQLTVKSLQEYKVEIDAKRAKLEASK